MFEMALDHFHGLHFCPWNKQAGKAAGFEASLQTQPWHA